MPSVRACQHLLARLRQHPTPVVSPITEPVGAGLF